ncbi:hypothetical protein SynBIOSE41_02823 [Synechococcus sp. BIOS-E4-1]|nr:hypothetical protein SynBIOSE41_02823 [Synechococcus sp. BIOS-E4-1]
MNLLESAAKSGVFGNRSRVTEFVPIDASSSNHSLTSTNCQACVGSEHDLNDRIDELDLFTNHGISSSVCIQA